MHNMMVEHRMQFGEEDDAELYNISDELNRAIHSTTKLWIQEPLDDPAGLQEEDTATSHEKDDASPNKRKDRRIRVAGGKASTPINAERMALRSSEDASDLQALHAHADFFVEENVDSLQEHFALREAIIKELKD